MREKTGDKFLDDLFDFLSGMIDTGAEVHITDKSDPDNVVEHVFNAEKEEEVDIELPFDEICHEEHDDCDTCPHFDECYADEIYHDPDFDIEPEMWGVPDIRRIVFSGPATIVFWEDNTKTVVKAMAGEKVENYAGFAAACMKKMFGSTSRAKAIMNELATEEIPKGKKNKEIAVPDLTEAFSVQQTAHNEAIQEAIDEALG